LAIVPVRDGVLPGGAGEAVAECAGRAIVCGSSPTANELDGVADDVRTVELGAFDAGRWAEQLAPLVDDDIVVLPASPDGRDLAPRLARALGRQLIAGAVEVTASEVRAARAGGLELHVYPVTRPVVVSLQPGIRGLEAGRSRTVTVTAVDAPPVTPTAQGAAVVIEVLPPDVTTMDLAEAPRIVGGGAGLDSPERFAQLAAIGTALGASMGATRVVTDRGWVGHERQIGTTGVVVDPRTYLAFGISGAVQHTAGLGTPDVIISVNTDAHCPMMQMADLGIVADANAVLDELAALVGVERLVTDG
jgi:electron transfer flavoprotein alpha subunit